jgi:TonB family protein
MKSAQSPSIDFNQMLVVSVFFHFFMFTVLMFLPQTQKVVKRIKPAFMVSMVDVPSGPEAQPVPPAKETPVVSPPRHKTPIEKPVVKKAKPIPEKPKVIPPKPATKALVSKLDQLAKLEKRVPEKKVVSPKQPILDDTFQKLESLKKKPVPKKKPVEMVAPKPVENVLEGFEDIKMKTAAEKKSNPARKKTAKEEPTREEIEFANLSKRTAERRPEAKPEKTSKLLKELNDLSQMNKQARANLDQARINKSKPDSNASKLVKQLESIKKQSVQIKIDTSKLSLHSQKFKSDLHKIKVADFQKNTTGPAATGELGDPGADALSYYLGLVKIKIDEQWKDPLGGGTGSVQVSFTIYPKGNIAMPKIVKSSGVGKLDNLAIRAVKNAVPLPPFPKEFQEPNLPLTFEFTYETSKS